MPSTPVPSSIHSFNLDGPAGRLEALLNAGNPDARYAALVCHPHPLGGGTMHNKVVYHAMKALHRLGLPVLRFNFRGTGLSEGAHDKGVGMRACCGDPRVAGLIALGLPVEAEGRKYTYPYLPKCGQPKLFVSGDHDRYGPVAAVEAVVATAANPKQLVWIEGADHFFVGKLHQVQVAMIAWIAETFDIEATAER